MKIEERIKLKLEEAIDILKKFGMPSAQQNERTAYCLLSLLNVTPEKEWKNADSPLVGITPMMTFAKDYYNKNMHRTLVKPFEDLVHIKWCRQELYCITRINLIAL